MHVEQRDVAVLGTLAMACYVHKLMDNSDGKHWEFMSIWDDNENFLKNPVIRNISVANLRAMATMGKLNVYEPLGWLLKAVVYACFGMDSRAVRMTTLILHASATVCLANTSLNLLQMLQRRTNCQLQIACMLSALLYAVHPIHVEIIGWPSAQPYALAGLFASLSMFHHTKVLKKWHDEALKNPGACFSQWQFGESMEAGEIISMEQ